MLRYFFSLLLCLISILPLQANENINDIQKNTSSVHTQTQIAPHFNQDNQSPVPFGTNLFSTLLKQNMSDITNPEYLIAVGDLLTVDIWGGVSHTLSLTVDENGNIFIPEVGPVKVKGTKAKNINHVINHKIQDIYQDNVEAYARVANITPVSIFVSGGVLSPARYHGSSSDSILDYLQKAGGIDPKRGSFRHIHILRNNVIIEKYDLYDFLKKGLLPHTKLQHGDVIFVANKGPSIIIEGYSSFDYAYELKNNMATGRDVMSMAPPETGVTDVLISGFRKNIPYHKKMKLDAFETEKMYDSDQIFFEKSGHAQTISLTISGAHQSDKKAVVPKGTYLKEFLANIEVNPKLSNTQAIYINRKSVAVDQKQALSDSVGRLQETLLLARPSGNAQKVPVSQSEITLLDKFIARTQSVQPEGRVVVSPQGVLQDIILENEDEIIIPQYSHLVQVTGEVHLPKAVVWHEDIDLDDYIDHSGGFTDTANEDDIIVVRANGETKVGDNVSIYPGDKIIVMPEVKVSNLDLASAITDIIYKTVLAVAIPIRLGND